MRAAFVSIAMIAGLAGAFAQEDLTIDQSRLYVSDPKACAALEEDGADAWLDSGFLTLSFTGGIQSIEFHCNFYDVKSRAGGNQLFIDAICELPGEIYPDVLAVTPWSESEIQVVSQADLMLSMSNPDTSDTSNPLPGATLYTRCDNLSEIPFD